MKIKKKMTRKQLLKQEDEFISASVITINWFKKHYNKVIMGGVFLVIFLIAVFGIRYQRKSNLEKSNSFLAMAKTTYYAKVESPSRDPNVPLPPQAFTSSVDKYQKSIDMFEQLLKAYPHSKAAEEARFFIPNCLHFLGKYDQAIEGFNAYMTQYPKGIFFNQAKAGVGYAEMDKGNYSEAIKLFQQIVDNNPNYVLRDAILMAQALCYEKTGDRNKAKELYQQIVINFADSPFIKDAQRKINLLEGKG